MNTHRLSTASIAASLGLLCLAGPTHAQIASQTQQPSTSVDRSFDPAPKDCSDVRWSQAALAAFPSIGAACQAVEQRNGRTFVKLEGTVESVKDGGKRIRVDFEDGEELSFRPSQQMALYLDGERTRFSELDDGMRLNFYIPEDRLQAELQPNPTRIAFVVIPLDMPLDTATDPSADRLAMNELPATASMWPWIGAGGATLVLLGAGLTARRRFHN
jgi:LPXTG-motif cell wall-anchored protein